MDLKVQNVPVMVNAENVSCSDVSKYLMIPGDPGPLLPNSEDYSAAPFRYLTHQLVFTQCSACHLTCVWASS